MYRLNKKSKKNDDSLLPTRFASNCVTANLFDDLPPELLKLIFEWLRISVGGLIRISAVCKSWKILADSIRHEQQHHHIGPFLLARPVTMNDDHTIYLLFDLYKNRSHRIKVPVIHTTSSLRILNSWNEWIITCTRGHQLYGNCDGIRFLNLLSKEEIEIPHISHVAKVISSSKTPLNPNCIFMAIFGEEKKLALYEQGGEKKKWNRLINSEFGKAYEDIVYFKGDFYAIDEHGNLVVLHDINKEPKLLKVASSVKTTTSDFLYLVESCGDLFLIIRTFRLKNNDASKKCEAYKLNSSRRMWQKVNNLGDNNSAFFVGDNVSISVSAKDFPVTRDCIYNNNLTFDGRRKGHNVFNINTNHFESNFLFS